MGIARMLLSDRVGAAGGSVKEKRAAKIKIMG
jgi:hypothetical protein